MSEITKTLEDGRTAVITARIYDNRATPAYTIDGKPGDASDLWRVPEPMRDGIHQWAVGKLLLTDQEADAVREMTCEAQAAHDATPVGAAALLRSQRRALVQAVNVAHAAASDNAARAHDTGNLGTYFREGRQADEAAEVAAEEALAEFDRTHPEILAEQRTNRAADVARWADL